MDALHFQTYRLQLVRETALEAPPAGPVLDGPPTVSQQLIPLFEGLDREHFVLGGEDFCSLKERGLM